MGSRDTEGCGTVSPSGRNVYLRKYGRRDGSPCRSTLEGPVTGMVNSPQTRHVGPNIPPNPLSNTHNHRDRGPYLEFPTLLVLFFDLVSSLLQHRERVSFGHPSPFSLDHSLSSWVHLSVYRTYPPSRLPCTGSGVSTGNDSHRPGRQLETQE